MSRRQFSTTSSLVKDLLARYEKNPGATNLIAATGNVFATVDHSDAFDEELAELERAGGIERIWKGHKSERFVTSVRLKNADVLYRRAGRRPSGELASESVSSLRARADLSEGAMRLIDDVVDAWTRGVSHIGIAFGEADVLARVIDLAIAVHLRLTGASSIEQDFRTFSRLTVGDSKALEKNARSVIPAMQKIFGTDDEQARLDPEELLASAGIKRLPQPLLIHGPVALSGRSFPSMSYVGIPTERVHDIELLHEPDYVLTIENFTSFVRHVREIAQREKALVFYSGGFPSRPTLATIARLAAEARVPTFHWGDMDIGGVRIFQHIERKLEGYGISLRPHLMDKALLARVGTMSSTAGNTINSIGTSAIAELAYFIAESGLAHEQEEFDPQSPRAIL
ncbi:Wadjet anti-phage system protein JetD domain-containing protein [Tardiphaga sp. OK245]|uniref:Wadjet anti-phage system protein JetD domain-containing protein n=1 Tax=Tardiphaga sp. OK245 TaxID=1855306 RepID=UPI0008A78FB1|nr:Wadjet anti-phage system protein JetD domain-containing protein [Tardiphaga sp. OK245]SEH43257.1 hypothetical protein SAMN05216367_0240 [Tardiphaga sp. OK245]